MSFLDPIFNIFRKQINTAIFGFFYSSEIPKMGEKEFLKAYRGWVYACVNAISQPIAEMELKLQNKTKDGWLDVEDHPALEPLHRVNDFMSFYDLLFATQAYLELDGNTFWYLPRSSSKTIEEIWPLDPTRTEVVKDKNNFISGFVFTNQIGTRVPLTPNEIIHFKHFNPLNAYRGMGTVQAAAIAIDIDTFASEWQRNFFGNAAMPSAILSSEGSLNQEQYDRIRANWDAKFKGVQNAHKMAILEGGLKFTPLSPTAREMQFSEGRKNIRDEILAIFRVPKTVIGVTEDVNFASAQASEYVFSKYVIKPKMKFIITTLNEFYLPLFNLSSTEYRFNFTDPVPENIEQQIAIRESAIKNYYMRPNEARKQIGLEPVEGGDEIYVPNNMQPMVNSQENEGPKQEADAKARKRIKKLLQKPRRIKVNRKKQAAKRSSYITEQITILYKEYLALNEKLKAILLKNLMSKKSAKVFKRRIKQESADELVRILFSNYNDWVGLVYNATKEGLMRIMAQSGKDALAEVNVEQEFDLQNPRALDWLNTHALEDSKSYSDTMKEDIALDVQEGVEQGESVDQVAITIASFFDEESEYRADRIARTETVNAYAEGNLEGYKQSGVVTGKEWLADESACDICQENADAGVIPLDEDFPSGDDAPTAHPNCECALQPVVDQDLEEE